MKMPQTVQRDGSFIRPHRDALASTHELIGYGNALERRDSTRVTARSRIYAVTRERTRGAGSELDRSH